jgi:AGCS family alanine or glycine:cation symporter
MTYLFGTVSVLPYRILYVLGFFVAAISDTSLIWLVSAITIALMTIPNLIAILLLRSEVRDIIEEYWDQFEREHPEGR